MSLSLVADPEHLARLATFQPIAERIAWDIANESAQDANDTWEAPLEALEGWLTNEEDKQSTTLRIVLLSALTQACDTWHALEIEAHEALSREDVLTIARNHWGATC